ncbi:unnamed protein product [Bemisia tabaci]|uniref:Leptin receptor-like protein n=1 Tax=Bemisia tabaci TaxID=7038 RepID=A0A9P0ANE7_BEMTA|nr:PREDICTED: leptin receptor gene-related protein [Bemisia tabaci]CAH0394267.1 unnamed protein product [Bemisia tabaci]
MTMVILGCALPSYKSWWPFVVVVFYILAPLPTMFTKSYNDRTGAGVNMDLAIFITMGFVVSSFALPIVLARAPVAHPVIKWGACNLTLCGNIIVYLTYIGYFVTLYQEDSNYGLRF